MFRRGKKRPHRQWITSTSQALTSKRPAEPIGGAFAFDYATRTCPNSSITHNRAQVELPLKLALLMTGGGVGTVARFFLNGVMQRFIASGFPWGTFAVNVLGSFAFGFIWAVFGAHNGLSAQLRLLLLVGFMGGFTTFSSFAFETTELLENSGWLVAAGNILLHNLFGIVAVLGGLVLGRLLASLIEGMA
jgi:CrcB protein